MSEESPNPVSPTPMRASWPSPEEFIASLVSAGVDNDADAARTMFEIARAAREAGGRALLVGGCVRDVLIGGIPKDFDLEIARLDIEIVEQIARRFGTIDDAGRPFGVFKLTLPNGVCIDIALPRQDSKMGQGHRGITVKSDPHLSEPDAFRRRDFTINAIGVDPLTGELVDPFGGVKDLQERILRVVDARAFGEDPLRVVRGAQFVSRLRLTVDPASSGVMRACATSLSELSKSRICKEWRKLLVTSPRPSQGLRAAMEVGIIDTLHTPLSALPRTPQDPVWHPEGDVWTHTCMVVDEMTAIIKREKLNEDEAWILQLAALSHDLGKPSTTVVNANGTITSSKHEEAGVDPARRLLASMGVESGVCAKVEKLVAEHLKPSVLWEDEHQRQQRVNDGTIRRLAGRLAPATIRELAFLAEADVVGRGFQALVADVRLSNGSYLPGPWLIARAEQIGVEQQKSRNLIEGRDFTQLFGFPHGKHLGKLIQLANELRDSHDFSRDAVLEVLAGVKTPDQAISVLQSKVGTQ